ncbi:MAG: carboxypeptidase M32 [Anaerolineales bacterium]
MDDRLARLKTLLAEIADLSAVSHLLAWDQQVNLPAAAAETRGRQLAALGRISHNLATSPELGRLIESLREPAERLDPDSDDARLIRTAARDFEKETRVPSEFVAEFELAAAVAFSAWTEARAKSDFSLFQPHLEQLVGLRRRYIGFFPPSEHPYDILLDDFDPGLKTAEVRAVFDALRPEQTALIRRIAGLEPPDDSFLHRPFDEQSQLAFGREVITRFGFDWNRGRLDRSAHPFSDGLGDGDTRITTRVDPAFFTDCFFSILHEAGHGLYDQGIPPEIERGPLGRNLSLSVHESQSRLWENLVGRSLPFWECFYPRLLEVFPSLADIPLERFHRGINRVQPSLIRTDADEATYNLHVMLRFELELALMEGSLAVRDLPEAWNERMREYLGVVPDDDAHGVLQDVHWSSGLFGYFPTYALGNLVSVQLWEAAARDLPDLESQIRAGAFGELLAWLREKVHRHGRKFSSQDLVRRVTGSPIDPQPYLRYLERKFGALYHLPSGT